MECIACSNKSLEMYSKNSFLKIPILQCKNCKIFISGESLQQLKTSLKEFYDLEREDLNKENKEKIDHDFKGSIGRYAKNLWYSHFKYCKKQIRDLKDLLEIGPRLGLGLRMFDDKGFNVVGMEHNEKFVKLINDRLKNGICKVADIENDDVNENFDIIWMSHCYEHFLRPDLLLKKCKGILNDDGFIFIAVPDCENSDTLEESIFDNASSYHYSKKSIRIMAENAGLRVVKCESVRELYRFEGRFHMILEKYFKSINQKICPYHPFKTTQKNNGREIRVILKK